MRPGLGPGRRSPILRQQQMASIGHVIVGIAAARLIAPLGSSLLDRIVLAGALSALALAPDADVIAFWLRIPYAAEWGHRGASHSLLLAGVIGAACGLLLGRWTRRVAASVLLCVAVAASHGLLDALTDGGLGVALLWPWSLKRIFAPLRPLPVAPIGLRLLSPRGLQVIATEVLYFLPLLLWALWPWPRAVGNHRRAGT